MSNEGRNSQTERLRQIALVVVFGPLFAGRPPERWDPPGAWKEWLLGMLGTVLWAGLAIQTWRAAT